MSNKIGESIRYMLADKTNSKWADSPVQDGTIPIYLGNPGVDPPDMDKVCITRRVGNRDIGYRIDSTLSAHDPINPFDVPLLMLVRIT